MLMLGNKPTASTKAGLMSVGSYRCKEIHSRLACKLSYAARRQTKRELSSGEGQGHTFGALEACRASGNDLTDAMSFSPDQAVCQIDEDCSSGHAVHQLDVLKGRLAAILGLPVAHTTTCFT